MEVVGGLPGSEGDPQVPTGGAASGPADAGGAGHEPAGGFQSAGVTGRRPSPPQPAAEQPAEHGPPRRRCHGDGDGQGDEQPPGADRSDRVDGAPVEQHDTDHGDGLPPPAPQVPPNMAEEDFGDGRPQREPELIGSDPAPPDLQHGHHDRPFRPRVGQDRGVVVRGQGTTTPARGPGTAC